MTPTTDSPSDGPTSTISNDRASVDFRSMPTRADVGMGSQGHVAYPTGAGSAAVPTTLTFPTGTVRRDFFQINIGTNVALALDKDSRHQPTEFEFFLKAKDIEQARSFLSEDAAALGLTRAEVDDVTSQGTSVERGYVKDWLSTEIEVRDAGNGDGSLNIIYSAAIGYYHNEAVDKILQDGVVSVDLRQRPTRDGLGFQATYDTADVTAEPGKQLTLRIATTAGEVELPLDSMGSQATGDRPTISVASAVSSVAALQAALERSAPALGIDPDETKKFLEGAGRTMETRNLTCSSTEVYTCALRLQASTSEGEQYGANYRLTLTYR